MFKSFRAKHPTIFGAVVGLALASASAALAFAVYNMTLGGTATSPFATGTNQGSVITGAQESAAQPLDVGQSVQNIIDFTNNDTSAAHAITADTETFTTKDSGGNDNSATCASHLSWSWGSGQNPDGVTIPAGGKITKTGTIKADASTPNSCAGGSWTVTFGGTTN
jgi:hypothetical protein